MMREVTGAFFGSRKLDEALEDLRAEGITSDRVRVASMSGFADFTASMELSTSSPTQWITAEFAGSAEVSAAGGGYGLALPGPDDILPAFSNDDAEACAVTRVFVSIRDEAEMRAVCDIFSRLGTDDIDMESAAA